MDNSCRSFWPFYQEVAAMSDDTALIGDDRAEQYNTHLQHALETHPAFQPMDLQRLTGTAIVANLKAASQELRSAWDEAEGASEGAPK